MHIILINDIILNVRGELLMANGSKIEFELICEDILNNIEFKNLNKEAHHGITRYEHSIRVAKTTYRFAKFMHVRDYKETTRAALLHDFYSNKDLDSLTSYEKLSAHPNLALKNAKKYYDINSIQEDIIKNHMFPATKVIPKTKEGIIVSLTDKLVATYEMLHYKFSMQLSVLIIFIINIVNIQNS